LLTGDGERFFIASNVAHYRSIKVTMLSLPMWISVEVDII